MTRYLSAFAFAVVLFWPHPALSFCRQPQPRLVCAEYFASELVVKATLSQTKAIDDKDDPGFTSGYVYILRVNETLRGKASGALTVYEGNDSGRAGFEWVQGREYLLFLFRGSSNEQWELDGCGNSGPMSAAQSALSQIAAIKAATGGGTIYGVVTRQPMSGPPVSTGGVQIEVDGTAGHRVATTDERGQFQLSVPAGRYILRAAKEGSRFDPDPIGYEDPRNVQIEPGGCAQVHLIHDETRTVQ